MVERCPRASTSESTPFSENADPLRQRAVDRGRGPGGRFGRFRYFAESVQSAHLSPGLSITGNHQDAEDVLQESLLKADRAIAEFQGNSRFYTWLVRIAVNAALGKLTKQARLVGKVIA
jgi:RNA polymerase sigma-70 factor, ECF subfamily